MPRYLVVTFLSVFVISLFWSGWFLIRYPIRCYIWGSTKFWPFVLRPFDYLNKLLGFLSKRSKTPVTRASIQISKWQIIFVRTMGVYFILCALAFLFLSLAVIISGQQA